MSKKTTAAKQFDAFSKTYDGTHEWRAPQQILATVKELGIDPDAPLSILDIGAGTGELSHLLQQAFPNATIHGIDVSSDMLDLAVRKSYLDADKIKIADLRQNFPEKDASHDLVVSSGACEYMGDPERILGEMARVTKPGGHIVSTFREKTLANTAFNIMGKIDTLLSFIPGISPKAEKTLTTHEDLKTAAAQGKLTDVETTSFTAYWQNLVHPIPGNFGPPVTYITISAQKPEDPAP